MAIVFVTQIPSRREKNSWIPTIDISPATEFGEVEILLPSGMNYNSSDDIYNPLVDKLREFDFGNDFLLPMGDPVIISCSIAILARASPDPFMALKWDRVSHRYMAYRV